MVYNMIQGSDDMPTNKPRTMITFNDEELYKAVDEYRFEHRFRSQNEALMYLINRGIEALTGEVLDKSKEEISAEDKRILQLYHNTEPVYQGIALEILENHQAQKKKNRA